MIDDWEIVGDELGDHLDIEDSFQSTLDSLRARQKISEKARKADKRLEKEFGGGIDFLFAYGSAATEFAIFPDSILSRTEDFNSKYFAESDIDLIVGLEDPEVEKGKHFNYIETAADIFHDSNGNRSNEEEEKFPEVEIHPWANLTSQFMVKFIKAREDWEIEIRDEYFGMNMKGAEEMQLQMTYGELGTNFSIGSMKNNSYTNSGLISEIESMIENATEEGIDVEDNYFEKKYVDNDPCRMDKLKRNHRLVKEKRALDKADKLLNEEHESLPHDEVARKTIISYFGDEELARIFKGTITDSLENKKLCEVSDWVGKNHKINTEGLTDHQKSLEMKISEAFEQSDVVDVRNLDGRRRYFVGDMPIDTGVRDEDSFEIKSAFDASKERIREKYSKMGSIGYNPFNSITEPSLEDLNYLETLNKRYGALEPDRKDRFLEDFN